MFIVLIMLRYGDHYFHFCFQVSQGAVKITYITDVSSVAARQNVINVV